MSCASSTASSAKRDRTSAARTSSRGSGSTSSAPKSGGWTRRSRGEQLTKLCSASICIFGEAVASCELSKDHGSNYHRSEIAKPKAVVETKGMVIEAYQNSLLFHDARRDLLSYRRASRGAPCHTRNPGLTG